MEPTRGSLSAKGEDLPFDQSEGTDHRELVRLVESVYEAHVEWRDTSTELTAIRVLTQAILKAEWNVVKK